MENIFLEDLDDLYQKVKKEIKPSESAQVRIRTVVIFDLGGSTKGKLTLGHTAGTRMVLEHNLICREIVGRFDGRVVKELGDGALCEFRDPLKACLAALNVKKATISAHIYSKAAITIGAVEPIEISGILDILGTTVDRCARIQSLARPGQIIIDSAIKATIESLLHDYPNIVLGRSALVEFIGVGNTEVMELTTKEMGFFDDSRSAFYEGIEISTVQHSSFPTDTEPEQWLICDTCGYPISPDGDEGVLVLEEDRSFIRMYLFHKGQCKTVSGDYRNISDLTNPEIYVEFVLFFLSHLSSSGKVLKEPKGIVKTLMGLYRKVFRPSTEKEQIEASTVEQPDEP